MKAKITVRLKKTVHDPQGEAIREAFEHMGYTGVASVRQGKVFDIEFEGAGRTEAQPVLEDVARKILANPIIEEYVIDLEEES